MQFETARDQSLLLSPSWCSCSNNSTIVNTWLVSGHVSIMAPGLRLLRNKTRKVHCFHFQRIQGPDDLVIHGLIQRHRDSPTLTPLSVSRPVPIDPEAGPSKYSMYPEMSREQIRAGHWLGEPHTVAELGQCHT